MERGYVHVYTGDGKGKTTAALGLAVRARGAGLSVSLVQFIKSMEYHELSVLRGLGVDVCQFGRGCFITGPPIDEDKAVAARGLAFSRDMMQRQPSDVVILDEINVALSLGLLDLDAVLAVVRGKPRGVELVCTGRGAPAALIAVADLVTEMANLRHYYATGIQARDGIER